MWDRVDSKSLSSYGDVGYYPGTPTDPDPFDEKGMAKNRHSVLTQVKFSGQ